MPKLCRINIEQREKVFEDINKFAAKLKDKFNCIVYVFGSFARGEIHEGSDIDLIVVGDFKEMKKSNPFIKEVLKSAKKLA